MSAQSQVHNFEYIARLKFASLLRYTTDHLPADILTPNYFRNSLNYIAAGDEISVVCRHEDGSWTKFRVEVTVASRESTKVKQMGDAHTVAPADARSFKKQYLPGNNTYVIKTMSGEIVATGLNKAEADRMLAGGQAENEKAA